MPAPDPIKTCSTWINKNMYIRDSKPVVLVPLCILLTEYTLLTNQSTHSTTPGACATATDFILSIPLIKKNTRGFQFFFPSNFSKASGFCLLFFSPVFLFDQFFFHRWKGYFLCTLGKASVFFTSLFFFRSHLIQSAAPAAGAGLNVLLPRRSISPCVFFSNWLKNRLYFSTPPSSFFTWLFLSIRFYFAWFNLCLTVGELPRFAPILRKTWGGDWVD